LAKDYFFVPLCGIGAFIPSGCIPVLMTIKELGNDDATSPETKTSSVGVTRDQGLGPNDQV